MSQAYASNAEAVSDYLKNYTDEQINTVGEMVSNETNIALSEWRDKAEKLRAQGDANIEAGGEALGGVLGIKGIGKGIKKVKALYKKGQEAKKAAEDAVKKAKDTVSKAKDTVSKVKDTVSKGKESVEKIKKDLEDKTKSRNDKAKENNEGEDNEGEAGTADIDEDTDKAPSTQQEGGDDTVNQASQEGQGDAIGQEGGAVQDSVADSEAIDFDNLADTSTDTLRSFFTRNIAEGRSAIAQARAKLRGDQSNEEEDSNKPPSTEQEGQGDAIGQQGGQGDAIGQQGGAVEDSVADSEAIDLDDIFDKATGGTEEGSFTATEQVLAKNPFKLGSRIGEGDVESVLQRPTRTTLNQDTEPTQETSFDDDFSFDQPASIGGESEMNVYSNTAPRSYNVQTNSATGATENTSLENTLQNASEQVPKTIAQTKPVSMDSPQPDASRPVSDIEDLTEDTESPLGQDILQLEGLSDKATLASSDLPFAPASSLTPPKADPTPPETDAPDVIAEPLEDTEEPAGVDIGEYASKITASLAKRGASIRQTASSAYQTIKKKVLDEPEESKVGGGDDGEPEEDGIEDTVADETADDVGSGLADVALGAIPVVGELAAVGGAIYGIYTGLEDLFGGGSNSKPPKVKSVGTTLAGGNPLLLGDSSFANKLTTGIATHDDAMDISGSLSF
jgi:hypothetical protein